MKDGEINPPRSAEPRHKPEREQHRPQPLNAERALHDLLDQPDNTCYLKRVDALLQPFPLLQPDALLEQNRDIGTDRHKSKPADLYHAQYDKLSKDRPVLIRVRDNQPCDAGRGRRRKQRTQRISMPGSVCYGQREQQRSRQDDHRKPKRDLSRRGLFCRDLLFLKL